MDEQNKPGELVPAPVCENRNLKSSAQAPGSSPRRRPSSSKSEASAASAALGEQAPRARTRGHPKAWWPRARAGPRLSAVSPATLQMQHAATPMSRPRPATVSLSLRAPGPVHRFGVNALAQSVW